MKKLLITIAIVLLATPCFAQTISWNALTGAEGYAVYFKPISNTTFTEVDVGNVTTVNLGDIGCAVGIRYEIYARAYLNTPPTYYGESDHFIWTYPSVPATVVLQPDEKIILTIERAE